MIEVPAIVCISAASFLFSLILTPIVRDAFQRLEILDVPDGRRKLHAHPVPRVGGIPIVLSYIATFAVLLMLPGAGAEKLQHHLPFAIRLLPAASIIFLTGMVDDVYGIRPWQKIVGQVLGAVLAVWAGVRIVALGGLPLPAWVAAALTIFWIVGCTNAFNLIDGLDGLASGMGLFSTLTIFLAALLTRDNALALATLPLCGALAGFLRYNFNPASVFLGDSGSLLIGFLLGCYGVIWSQKSATLLGMTAPLMTLAIPLLDVTLSIVRRWLRGQPISRGDRSHIHHRLLARGLTHRRVVIVLYVAGGLYAGLSLLQSFAGNHFGGLILVLFCAVTWLGVQNLGYFEFGLAGRVLLGGALRRVVHGQIALHSLESDLQSALNPEECWRILEESAGQFGFHDIHARISGKSFQSQLAGSGANGCWQLRIPLPEGDYVNVSRAFDAPLQPAVIGPLIELLHSKLAPRLAGWRSSSQPVEIASLINLATNAHEPASRPAHPARA